MKKLNELVEGWSSVYVHEDEPELYSKKWHEGQAERHEKDASHYRSIGFNTLAAHKSEEAEKHRKLASEAK